MALIDLWSSSRIQLEDKQVQQIISIAGSGQLKDDNSTSQEFREFLSLIPSNLLQKYADQCLQNPFPGSGFALQDIVNQIGRRLGFNVVDGRYRGTVGKIGFDGLWKFREGHIVIVEVKTTDAYRIDLETIAKYRRSLISRDEYTEENSSILIVVGRENTGDLEAQIRGSRHAWDIRLISVVALLRLMSLKESVEDPLIISRISAILIPREFTKLDEIIEILFSTAEDIKSEEEIFVEDSSKVDLEEPRVVPVSFHDACVAKAEAILNKTLVKLTRTSYQTPDGLIGLTCAVSKIYPRDNKELYWFAFHSHYKDFLENSGEGFVLFGCGSVDNLIFIPISQFVTWLA